MSEEDDSEDVQVEEKEPGKKRGDGRPFLYAGGGLFVLVLALLIVVVVSRDSIGVSVAEEWLQEHGIECPDLQPDISADLSELSLPETTCTMAEGPLSSFTLGASTVELSGFEPSAVEVDTLTLNLRDRNVPPAASGWMSALASLAGVQERLRQLMMDGAELSDRDWPEITVGTLLIQRGGTATARLETVKIVSEEGDLSATVERVRFHGHESVQVTNASAAFTPTNGTVEADVEAEVRVLIATVRQQVRATVTGTALDTGSPRFQMSL